MAEFGLFIRDPAPGYRFNGFGSLFGVGSGGYSWSSSINGSDARFLYFHHSEISPKYSYYRAHARQVRCLLE